MDYIAAARLFDEEGGIENLADLRAKAEALTECSNSINLVPTRISRHSIWASDGGAHAKRCRAHSATMAARAETVYAAVLPLRFTRIDFADIFGKHGVNL